MSVLSTQDTLFIKGGPLYFLKCRITGTVDYICGNGPAWFDGCELVFLDRGPGQGGVLTANNCTQNERYGFVFNHCTVTGASNTIGHCWLGRPWGTFSWASVTFLKCKMDGSIAALGWLPWDMTTPDPNARFGEYGTMDKNDSPVNLSQRAGHSQGWNNAAILTDSQASTFNLANVLGSWKPSYAFDGAARHSGTSQRW